MGTILLTKNLEFIHQIKYPNIEITSGKYVFICGESGCGKSTFLKLANATVSPSKGCVCYKGTDVGTMDTVLLRKNMILISQEVYLFDGTIQENFEKYYEYREEKVINKEEMKKFLRLCCADFSLDRKCKIMSGGERQRVFIAICLSFMPEVLLLDEPTSALDGDTAEVFLNKIKIFSKENEITVVCVCHDRKLASQYADEIILLERNMGKIEMNSGKEVEK